MVSEGHCRHDQRLAAGGGRPAAEIVSLIGGQWPHESAAPAYHGELARRYRYRDGAGEVSVNPSVTQPFCRGWTAPGSPPGASSTPADTRHDLRGPLRGGASDQALRGARRRDLDLAYRPLL